jgi:molybdopterin converting factor small subunit
MMVRTNFVGEVKLEMEMPTLGKVLTALCDKSGFPIYSPNDGEIGGDFKVYLNGVEYERIVDGDVPLKAEDAVEVTLVILSGG